MNHMPQHPPAGAGAAFTRPSSFISIRAAELLGLAHHKSGRKVPFSYNLQIQAI